MKFEKRHRPQTLDEVIFASSVVKQTMQEYAANKRDKHILLYGPKGTGKSVTAKLVLKERMGNYWQPGIDDIRNAKAYGEQHEDFEPVLRIWNMQLSLGASLGCTVFDEIDQFTLPMQHKLRAFMDGTELGTIIATTNNLHLVDGPLKDRFRSVPVDYPSNDQWAPRVQDVLVANGIPLTFDQARSLLNGFEGSGRNLDDWMEDYVLQLRPSMMQLSGSLLQSNSTSSVSLPHESLNSADRI